MEEENLSEKKEKKTLKISKTWIAGIAGVLIGVLLMAILWYIGVPYFGNETLASFKGGRLTKNTVYNEMKKYYPISYILDLVDEEILKDKYTLTEEETQELTEEADKYISMYAMYYGYTEEQFLSENGFSSKEDFINYLSLDKKRNLYYIDYLKTIISKEEIEAYYNDNVYGEINTNHMLVKVSEDVTEDQALKLAKEIITKLDKGTSFADVAAEYKDKVTYEELGYNGFNSGLVSEYVEGSKALENNAYSKEPVKTEFGYHVIYRIDQKEKESLENVENQIVEILGKNLEKEDEYLQFKALIKLREENNLKFTDKNYQEEYDKYCKEVNGEEE